MSKVYKRILLRVETFYENGQPAQLTHIRDDDQVELSDNDGQNHFIIAYTDECAVSPKPIPPGGETYP